MEHTSVYCKDNRVYLDFEIKSIDEETHRIVGYATTEAIDFYNEIVPREAISKALKDYARWANVREAHNPLLGGAGVARILEMDEKGLWLEAEIVDGEVWKKIVKGVYKAFSIGFQKIKDKIVAGIKKIIELVLIEISVCDRPANLETAFVIARRSLDGLEGIESLEELERLETDPDVLFLDVVEQSLKHLQGFDFQIVGGITQGMSTHDIDIICEDPFVQGLIIDGLPPGYAERVHFVQEISGLAAQIFKLIPPTKPLKSGVSSNEFFDINNFNQLKGEYYVEPKYDGVRAQIHRQDKKVVIFTDEGNHIEEKFPNLVQNALAYKSTPFILDGEIVKYRGRVRLGHEDVVAYINRKNPPPEDYHFRFKLFDMMKVGEDDLTNRPLSERKKALADGFPDGSHIHNVKYETVKGEELVKTIRRVASEEGAMVKSLTGKYRDGSSWFKWKRQQEIDALVTKKETKEAGTFIYTCAIGTRQKPIEIGKTYATKVEAEEGDIIRVTVDHVSKTAEGYSWYAPKVLGKRSDKKEPDPIAVVERLAKMRKKGA